MAAEERPSFAGRALIALIGAGVGCALLYFGGWGVIWGETSWNVSAIKRAADGGFAYWSRGFAVQFNSLWYGLQNTARFFDSQVIQWIMGVLGLTAFWQAFMFLFGDDEAEKPAQDE